MENFGERLRIARQAKGLIQRELAEKIGVSHVIISDYECGKASPSEAVVEKLALVFPLLVAPKATVKKGSGGAVRDNFTAQTSPARCAGAPRGEADDHVWWYSRGKKLRVCERCPVVEHNKSVQ